MTGITNETYKISQKESNLQPVIYRRFGESDTSKIYIIMDRLVPGQGHIKDHLQTCFWWGVGPQDLLLHRWAHSYITVHWVESAQRWRYAQARNDRECCLHLEKVPFNARAGITLKKVFDNVNLYWSRWRVDENMPQEDESWHLHLTWEVTSGNVQEMDFSRWNWILEVGDQAVTKGPSRVFAQWFAAW